MKSIGNAMAGPFLIVIDAMRPKLATSRRIGTLAPSMPNFGARTGQLDETASYISTRENAVRFGTISNAAPGCPAKRMPDVPNLRPVVALGRLALYAL